MANTNNRSIARFVTTSIVALVATAGVVLSTESAAFAHRGAPLHRTPVVALAAGDDLGDVAKPATTGRINTPRAAKTRRAQVSYVIINGRN